MANYSDGAGDFNSDGGGDLQTHRQHSDDGRDFEHTANHSDGGGDFDDIPRALLALFVMLTTANFPDVMLPAYRDSRAACFFFIAFLVLGRVLERSKVEQSKRGQSKVEQSTEEQIKVEQSKVEQSKVEQSTVEQSRTE